jgi:hypothetical protein
MDGIDNLLESHLTALQEIEREKLRVARFYNKRVKEKSFQVEDLVWKRILPLGAQDCKFGKWSPSWGGGFHSYKGCLSKHIFRGILEGRSST